MIMGVKDDCYVTRKVLRELTLLRKLSEMKDNIFTTKILDIILPLEVEFLKDGKKTYDFAKLTHIFIVLELQEFDLKKMLDEEKLFQYIEKI